MVIAPRRAVAPKKRTPDGDLLAFRPVEKHLRARFDHAIFVG
jgi:hypothetical protein